MSSTQTNNDTRSIVVDFDLPQAPDRVWRALTDSNLIEQWLMPNTFRAQDNGWRGHVASALERVAASLD